MMEDGREDPDKKFFGKAPEKAAGWKVNVYYGECALTGCMKSVIERTRNAGALADERPGHTGEPG